MYHVTRSSIPASKSISSTDVLRLQSMSSSFKAVRNVVAQVLPLHSPSSHLGTPSSSRVSHHDVDVAQASSALWDTLVAETTRRRRRDRDNHLDLERIGVAVQWPEDWRLRKGKERSLVVWVTRDGDLEVCECRVCFAECWADVEHAAQSTSRQGSKHLLLRLSAHLLPPFPTTSLFAKINLHDPIDLSLVILQPVIPINSFSDTSALETDDLDRFLLYSKDSPSKPEEMHIVHHLSIGQRILRERDTVTLPPHHSGQFRIERQFKILMLEPVQQGIISQLTRIVVSAAQRGTDIHQNGEIHDTMSERLSTHLSLADFDADAFLSSSLTLSKSHASGREDGAQPLDSEELSSSVSSDTSGSLTPRPGSELMTPPSPSTEIMQTLADKVEPSGTKFTVVRAMGSSASENQRVDVCWLGIGGLGRAGIFEGDWVGLRL